MPWIRTREIEDPAACQDAFVNSHFEAFPSAAGNYLFKTTQVGMDRLWMARYSLSLPQVNVFRIRPERTVIGFLTDTSSSIHYCGVKIPPGDIVINRAREAHQRTDTALNAGTMSLPTDELDAAIEAVVGVDFMRRLAGPLIRPSPALMSRLLKLHRAVGRLAQDTPEIIELPEVHRALEEQLIHLMVRCLAEGLGVEITTGIRRHDAIMTKFENFLASHPDRPLYLTEICAGIGVAERTLRAACDEHLGMGPIRYLALRRMYLVRRALLGADASKTSVTRVVTDHGFWELGRFSVAYRALFGESPAETLRQPSEPRAVRLDRPSSLPADIVPGQLNRHVTAGSR